MADTTIRDAHRPYLPGMGVDWLLPLYDPLTWLLGAGRARRDLLLHADLRPGQRALDIGCGTGTLVVLLKRLHPDVDVAGVDPDPRALARAARKARRAGVQVRLARGFSDALDEPDGSVDRVFSSFMFHHLDRSEQVRTLAEVTRVLRPGGRLHLLDFGRPGDAVIPELLREAGLAGGAGVRPRLRLLALPVVCYRAERR